MNYVIVKAKHVEKIDFSKVKQTSPNSLRYSLDRKFFLLKYEGDQPEFIFSRVTHDTVGLKEYSHPEIIEELKKRRWKKKKNQKD
jgi:hypothetical protein